MLLPQEPAFQQHVHHTLREALDTALEQQL